MEIRIRRATVDDAPFMVPLCNAAGGGMPLHIWGTLAGPGETPWDVGLRRARSDDAPISWRKAWIAEGPEGSAGLVIGYRQPDRAEDMDQTSVSPLYEPMVALEAEAPGTGYVHILAVVEGMRNKGVGAALLVFAERWRGPHGMSLTVADENQGARRFYARQGYKEAARRTVVKEGWQTTAAEWVLMRKP